MRSSFYFNPLTAINLICGGLKCKQIGPSLIYGSSGGSREPPRGLELSQTNDKTADVGFEMDKGEIQGPKKCNEECQTVILFGV